MGRATILVVHVRLGARMCMLSRKASPQEPLHVSLSTHACDRGLYEKHVHAFERAYACCLWVLAR